MWVLRRALNPPSDSEIWTNRYSARRLHGPYPASAPAPAVHPQRFSLLVVTTGPGKVVVSLLSHTNAPPPVAYNRKLSNATPARKRPVANPLTVPVALSPVPGSVTVPLMLAHWPSSSTPTT